MSTQFKQLRVCGYVCLRKNANVFIGALTKKNSAINLDCFNTKMTSMAAHETTDVTKQDMLDLKKVMEAYAPKCAEMAEKLG